MYTMLRLLFLSVFSIHAMAQPLEYKLSDDVLPLSQKVNLTLIPESDGFSGTTTIELNITKVATEIKLYVKELEITDVKLNIQEQTVNMTPGVASQYDILPLRSESLLPTGKATLQLSFKGTYRDDGKGLFKVNQNGRHYLFTQFQDMLARSVFPGFDQPNFKIPFQFSLQVPTNTIAISNTPVKANTRKSELRTFLFESTINTYTDVLAFAVGEFEAVSVPNMPVSSTLYLTEGKKEQAGFVLYEFAKVFRHMEAYFDTPFPYKKLDFIGIPEFPGAMENTGLVSFNENFLLLGNQPSLKEQKFSLKLIAHEIAHMWFGNLVTMEWWDDYWLNESFAEWLAKKAVTQSYPELNAELDLSQLKSLADDNIETQLPIRRNVYGTADVESMGQIVYSKGNAILNMVEQYVGESTMHKAIKNYIAKHKYGNATYNDFVKQIEESSKLELDGIFSSFLDQPGFPLISLTQKGSDLYISQRPFNSAKESNDESLWHVPLELKVVSVEGVQQRKILLNKKQMAITLPAPTQSVFPDMGGNGYFRFDIPTQYESALKSNVSLLNDREKLSWLENNQQLVSINRRAYADVFALKLALLSDLSLNPKIAQELLESLNFSYVEFVPTHIWPSYSRYLKTKLKDRLSLTPWQSEGNNLPLTSLSMNASLLELAGRRLDNENAIDFALSHYQKILSETSTLDSVMQNAVLLVVASHSGGHVFEQFKKAYMQSANSRHKSMVLTAMGYFSEEEVVTRYYDFLLSGAVPASDIGYRFQYSSFDPSLRHHLLDYIDANKNKILSAITQKQWFPYNFMTSCEPDVQARVNTVFGKWTSEVKGVSEKLKAIDGMINSCIQARMENLPELESVLQ